LKKHGVSMSRFESRPARSGQWEYYFYIDLQGHPQQPHARTPVHRPSAASLSARTMAPLLASTSSCSDAGTLSATSPAPAW